MKRIVRFYTKLKQKMKIMKNMLRFRYDILPINYIKDEHFLFIIREYLIVVYVNV